MNVMKKILYIEDSENFKRIYGDRLTRDGFDLHYASNGREGLEKVKAEKPDLVILDMVMPEMSGEEMLTALRALPEFEKLPVLVMSVLDQTELVKKMNNLSIEGYLIKGVVSPNQMCEKISEIFS